MAVSKTLYAKPFSSFHFFHYVNQCLDNSLVGNALSGPSLAFLNSFYSAPPTVGFPSLHTHIKSDYQVRTIGNIDHFQYQAPFNNVKPIKKPKAMRDSRFQGYLPSVLQTGQDPLSQNK